MIKLIIIPIIECKVLVVTPPHDPVKASKRFKMGIDLTKEIRNNPPHGDEACCYLHGERPRCVLWFEKKDMGLIVHETDHAIFHIFKQIGATNETEFRAYVKEWLFKEVKKALRIKTPK